MPGQKRLAGALAVAAAAVAISACGSSDDSKTIPPQNAAQLNEALSAVQSAIDDRQCGKAQQQAQNFVEAVNELPETVGTDDKETLRAAGEHLEDLAADPNQCKPEPFGTTDTPTTTSSTTSSVVPTTTTTTSSTTTTTSSTEDTEPAPDTGGDEGGGPPTDTGGGPPTDTGGGGETGGVGGGAGGTGGTGTGGTGGTGGGTG